MADVTREQLAELAMELLRFGWFAQKEFPDAFDRMPRPPRTGCSVISACERVLAAESPAFASEIHRHLQQRAKKP